MAVTTDEKPDLASSKPSDAHRMRVTSAGSIASYVRFALSFLQVRSPSQYRRLLTPHQTNPGRPLILHTYPPSPSATSADTPSKASSSTLTPCLLTTPKLISVVEITKRRYISQLEASKSGKGKNRATGIWQYTESGLSPVTTARSSDDGGDLTRVLEGKTKPKMTHNPYLEITLSTKPLGLEAGWGVACQYVLATRRRTRGNRKGEDAEEVDNGATKVDDEATKGIEIVEEDAGVAQDRQGGGQMGKKRKADASQEAGRGKKRGKGATRVHSTG